MTVFAGWVSPVFSNVLLKTYLEKRPELEEDLLNLEKGYKIFSR